jgi:hypothetical protein
MLRGICALCQKDAELQDSHLIPKGVYKALCEPDNVVRNPVLVTAAVTLQTSEQVHDYLLCRDCELRFAQNGEDWLMKNGPQRDGRFPLRDALMRSPERTVIEAGAIYKEPLDVAFDLEHFIYFAASVFWRASVHHWNGAEHLMSRAPLPQAIAEQLRRFLLHLDGFPPNTSLLLSVSAAMRPRPHCIFPQPMARASEDVPKIGAYGFAIPGLQFRFMYDKVPDHMKAVSVVNPPYAVLLSDRIEKEIFDSAQRLRETSRPVGSLAKL